MTGVGGAAAAFLEQLVDEAFSYLCMRPYATSVMPWQGLVELPPPSWSNQAAEMAQQVRDAGAFFFCLFYRYKNTCLLVQDYLLTEMAQQGRDAGAHLLYCYKSTCFYWYKSTCLLASEGRSDEARG